MSLKITHKYSTAAGTPPASGDIDVGEIAINAADAELYVKDSAGSIKKFANTDTTITAASVQFTQVGTGAVQRTVESKLQDAVSPLDFGAVGDGNADDTAALQAAINAAISSKRPLRGVGKTYKIIAPVELSGTSPSANGLVFYGENCTIVQNTAGQNGLVINGRSSIVVDRLTVALPTDTTGTGGVCLLFAGLSGWNRITDCTFTGGLHGIYNNDTGIFSTTFEKCRFFSQYGSHFKWISGGGATTISLRNCMGDGVTSTQPAFHVTNPGSGNGVENLEVTMCSADNCVQGFHLQSRYLYVNNLYVERARGAEWQNNFSIFNFPATYEPGFVHGLRCTLATAVPAGLTGISALNFNGQIVNSVRLSADFSASPNPAIICGGYTSQLNNVSNLVTGSTYGLYTSGVVFGTRNGVSALTVDPSSPGKYLDIKSLGGIGTEGVGSGNSTGESGIVFHSEGTAPQTGIISNGTFTGSVRAFSAILPYGVGGGTNNQGGLRVFVNPSTSATPTPVKVAEWTYNGHYVPGLNRTSNLGSASTRWKSFFAESVDISATTPTVLITSTDTNTGVSSNITNNFTNSTGSTTRAGGTIAFTKTGSYDSTFTSTADCDIVFKPALNNVDTEAGRFTSDGKLLLGSTSNTYQLELSTDSAGKPGTNTWTIVSDERIKENIELADLDLCYQAVKSIPLKRYKWREDVYTNEQVPDRHKLGWVAQDVAKVFPKAVKVHEFKYDQVYEEVVVPAVEEVLDENGEVIIEAQPERVEQGKLISEKVIDDCLNLNSDQLYAALYGAVQKLIAECESMKQEIADLKAAT